jgi:hypothetical protein
MWRSRVGERIAVTTNEKITNVYRGEYDYVVTKSGFKVIRGHLNLVERSGSLVECDLQLESQQGDAFVCHLK